MTLPLSITIVCRDNERTLPRVLGSIEGLASEVIALDSGSRDGTVGLLERAGARVIHQPWLGYVRQKQAALERCGQPWVLHLDSDESLEPELRRSVEEALRRDDPGVSGYEMNRRVWYAGVSLNYCWQPEYRLRLVRRGTARWDGVDPHDALRLIDPARGRVERLRGDMRHDSIESIGLFLEKQASHARTSAEAQHARGRRGRVLSLVLAPTGEFLKQLVWRSGWRDGWRGWVAASASAVSAAMKHAELIERSRAPMRDSGVDSTVEGR